MNGTCLPVINFYKQNDEYFIIYFFSRRFKLFFNNLQNILFEALSLWKKKKEKKWEKKSLRKFKHFQNSSKIQFSSVSFFFPYFNFFL